MACNRYFLTCHYNGQFEYMVKRTLKSMVETKSSSTIRHNSPTLSSWKNTSNQWFSELSSLQVVKEKKDIFGPSNFFH